MSDIEPNGVSNRHEVVIDGDQVRIERPPASLSAYDALVFSCWILYRALTLEPELPVDGVMDLVRYRGGSAFAKRIRVGILRSS